MLRSLSIALLTFVLLGSYYRRAQNTLADPVVEARRVARSAALAGANVARHELAQRWVDRRWTGTHDGGFYRAIAVVRRNRGAIKSTGIVESGPGHAVADYLVRIDLERQAAEAGRGYTVAVAETSALIGSS